MKEMTEIIIGLQGEPPADYRKGFHMLAECMAFEDVDFFFFFLFLI